MAQDISLFSVNENGEIIYDPADISAEEGASVLDGNVIDQTYNLRTLVPDASSVSSNNLENEEEFTEMDLLDPDDSAVPVVLSEEVTAAILAASPASGSIGSTTLDYFDRITSGLPADYKYIAYRTNSDNSYDAVLYYGRDYEISDNMIIFGDDAKKIEVVRSSSSGYNTETYYRSYDVSDTSVSFNQSGAVLYYTNAVPGYPVLGGYEQPAGYAPLITAALICALCLVVLQKLFLRR